MMTAWKEEGNILWFDSVFVIIFMNIYLVIMNNK